MTGKYLISFCKKLFSLSTPTYPFRRLRRHLPRDRGRLFCMSHFCIFYFASYKTMNSFFLSVSFPRTRWQANCVFRSIATRKRNETLRLWPGSAEPCEAIGARVRTQVRIVLLFLLQLAPSDGFAATLAKAKRLTHFYSVAPLLEKWFACFPTSGDGIRFPFCRFLQKPSKNFGET